MQYFPARRQGPSDYELRSSKMKLKPSHLLFSFIGILGIAFFLHEAMPKNGDPNPQREAALMQSLLRHLAGVHFQPKAIDDELSKSVYKLYLKDIDGGKRFYTRQDIDQMEAFETKIDDQAQAGTFEFFDLSVKLMDQSLDKTQGWYREILGQPIDFTQNDVLEADGDKLSWAKNDQELRERWVKWMKYEVLSRITDEQNKQNKADFKGDKKDAATIEQEQRAKVLDNYDKYFKRLKKLDRGRRMEIYLNSFSNVFDPHSGYYSPSEKENFDIQMSGKLEGIGARLQSDGEKTSVTEIVPGGPAWKGGELQPKDVVVKVGQGKDEPIDVMGWDIDDVVSKIRGKKGTTVRLTIQKPDGSTKEISIVRDVVLTEEGFAKSLMLQADKQSDKIGYIYLPRFYADFTPEGETSCYEDVKKEVAKL